jgi:hypothetical protein
MGGFAESSSSVSPKSREGMQPALGAPSFNHYRWAMILQEE